MSADLRPVDPARVQAFEQLLATRDAFDGWRRHRVTQPGDPDRRRTVLLPLLTRWAQQRCLAVDPVPDVGRAKVVPFVARRRA